MGSYYEGTAVIAPVKGVAISSSAVTNAETEIKNVFKGRWRECTHNVVVSNAWSFNASNNRWDSATSTNSIVFNIPCEEGEYLESIKVEVYGHASSTGGSLKLFHATGGSAWTSADITAASDVFNSASEITYTYSTGELPRVIVADHAYMVQVVSASNANTYNVRIYSVRAKLRKGNIT